MKPLPLRWRISAWSAVVTTGVLVVFAAGTLISLYREQLETVDTELREEALEAKGALAAGASLTSLGNEPEAKAFALVTRDGKVRQASRNFPPIPVNLVIAPDTGQTWHQNTATWRLVSYPWQGDRLWIASNLMEVRAGLLELLEAYLFVMPLAAALAAWGGWFVANRALLPVHQATRAAEQITGQALDRRLPSPIIQDEVGHLTVVINQMLDRIERSYRQAERFSADASHELRTPLTIMRGEIELLLQGAALPVHLEEKLLSVQEEINRLDRITEQLLLLAKFDAGRVTVSNQTMDFSALVLDACEAIELLADARRLTFTRTVEPGLRLLGDPILLRRLVLNLLDNATKYNRPEGWLHCTAERQGRHLQLTVRNSGPGIAPDHRPHIFERFFRAAGTEPLPGHGLGLSLCREITRVHGGTLHLDPAPPADTTSFTATFLAESL